MNRRRYAIIESQFLHLIDFSQVLQNSSQSVRYDETGSYFIVKWEGETPQTVLDLPQYEGPLTQSEILLVMTSPDWQNTLL